MGGLGRKSCLLAINLRYASELTWDISPSLRVHYFTERLTTSLLCTGCTVTFWKCFVSDSLGNCLQYGFWTAGQRVDPTRLTPFVWKLMTANGYRELPLNYTNWKSGEPNNYLGTKENIKEACMNVWEGHQYKWNDGQCGFSVCYVCEYDI